MPLFSRFTPFGHYAFSAKKSHGETIFGILKDNFGDTFIGLDNDLHQARMYAMAMVFASAQYQIDRAKNNKLPAKATELLGVLEHDYQVIPSPKARLPERRAYLSAVQTIKRGNRREAIEDALRMILGADFIEYRTMAPSAVVNTPLDPGQIGVFAARGTQRKAFAINVAVSVTGIPITVPITLLGATSAPLVGDKYCIDPDPRSRIEQVVISAVTQTTITTTFQKAHDSGTIGIRPHPYWTSSQRFNAVVVTPSAALDPEKRRKVNAYLGRALRGVSSWAIISNAGIFTSDDPVLGLPDCVPVF